nr:hypothetical protein CFP56_36201 [Quercus suber]
MRNQYWPSGMTIRDHCSRVAEGLAMFLDKLELICPGLQSGHHKLGRLTSGGPLVRAGEMDLGGFGRGFVRNAMRQSANRLRWAISVGSRRNGTSDSGRLLNMVRQNRVIASLYDS